MLMRTRALDCYTQVRMCMDLRVGRYIVSSVCLRALHSLFTRVGRLPFRRSVLYLD